MSRKPQGNFIQNNDRPDTMIFSDKLDDDGNELDFECTLSHFGANPKKNDVALKNAFPDLYL